MKEESKNTLVPVVAVIGIIVLLVVIRVVSQGGFDGRPGRSPVAKAKSEIRNLAVNLETYYIDHDTYPPAVDEKGKYIALGKSVPGISAGYVPHALTTPISYAASLPNDPFNKTSAKTEGTYRYATNGLACWILTSNGPDGDADIKVENYPSKDKGNCSWKGFMSHFGVGTAVEYDGTNGTKSSGDIVRVGP